MRPDFTGVWKLIRGESEFAFLKPPELRIDTIAHEEPAIRMRTRQKDANGDVTVDRDLVIGGDAVEIMIRGRARQVRACWEGESLVVETGSEVSGGARRIEDRWTLDESGEWLTILRVHVQPGGAVRQKLRMRRRV